jgi:hypothetical protein
MGHIFEEAAFIDDGLFIHIHPHSFESDSLKMNAIEAVREAAEATLRKQAEKSKSLTEFRRKTIERSKQLRPSQLPKKEWGTNKVLSTSPIRVSR